jgi:hypothetical protein
LKNPQGKEGRASVNNRQFRRMAFNAEVQVTHCDMTFTGRVENLSLKGLFINTDKKVRLNETVGITLTFKGSSANLSLGLEGQVVRVTDDGIGLHFRKISVESLEQSLAGVAESIAPEGGHVNEFSGCLQGAH